MGPHVVTVVSGPATDVELLRDGLVGDSDPERLRVRVRSDLAPTVRDETVIHELIHVAWHLTALPELLDEHEETVVRSLSPWIATAMTVRAND